MPVYSYQGINEKGKKTNGVIDAENDKVVRVKLRKLGIFPTSISLEGRKGGGLSLTKNVDLNRLFQRVRPQDVAVMTRQLSTLLVANIPLVEALQALVDQTENVKFRGILTSIREKVTEGAKLSDSMREYPKLFNDMYISMINAGENSGMLDVVMARLADFAENQSRIRGRIVGAMVYPAIMGVVGILLMAVLLIFMVPKLTSLFAGQKMTLPFITRLLIFVSDSFASYWWLLLGLAIGGIILARRWFATPKGREFKDLHILSVPIFGKLVRLTSISRFARTLSTLLSSGVPMLTAMDIVKSVVSNVVLRQAIEATKMSVKEGESIAEPLRRSGQFPPIVTHMISIGEKTGALEKMLERISDSYDSQVETAITTLLSLLEPLMILLMGGAISFVVMAILLPMMQLGDIGSIGM